MPELPEVETVARQLKPEILNKVIKKAIIHDTKLIRLNVDKIENTKIADVYRLGKWIVIDLVNTENGKKQFLCVHLRMTGRLLVKEFDHANMKHLRVEFQLDEGQFYFQDVRRFGVIELLDSLDSVQPKGIDPLSCELDSKRLHNMMAGTRQNIKTWLLRQDKLVGLGNIYASEILYAAKVNPQKQAGDISYNEAKSIFTHTRNILKKSIKNCGTTFSDFQNAKGETGEYQKYLKVYKREGENCRVCGTTILRIVQQQRSTFYCPNCQK